MKNRINSIFLFNIFLSVTLWGLVLFFSPKSEKYTIELIDEYNISQKETHYYEDLYSDGTSEDVYFVRDFIGLSSVLIRDNGKVPFQWNLDELFLDGTFFFIDDIDGDNIKEIFTYTHKNDSLFLNLYDTKNEKEIFSRLFITKFKQLNNRPDIGIAQQMLTDLDGDGNNELLFTLSCAFTHVTRKLCLVNIETKKVKLSPIAGTSIISSLTVFDIDDDGKKEIMGELFSPGNCKLDYPFSDRFSWLHIYDSDLQFKFKPQKIGNAPGRITVLPLVKNDEKYLATYFNHSGNSDSSFIALYSTKGELIRKRTLFKGDNYLNAVISTGDEHNHWLIYYSDGKVYEIDTLLNQKLVNKITPLTGNYKSKIDIDNDDKFELIYFNNIRNKLIIIKDNFSNATEIKHNFTTSPYSLSVQKEKGLTSKLVVSTKGKIFKYLYEKNIWHSWIWPIRLLLLIVIFMIILVISLIQKRLIARKVKSEKRITSLQIKALRNNINTHFTLNILNSIGSLYASSDIDAAEMAMGKFARLLRNALLSANSISVPLKEEIDFERDYLELEKIRMNGNLNYKIKNTNSVDSNISIPKMLIHTFVENAIKHGLKQLPQEKEKRLDISFSKERKFLLINIEDNGIGREEAKKTKVYSTGQGLIILDEIIKLFKQLEGNKINYKISDSELHESGTRVSIKIPLN